MRWRVVWGRGVTMLTFWPTRALSKVDLPTFGRPTRAAKPLWNSGDGVCDIRIAYPTGAPLGGLLGRRYGRVAASSPARGRPFDLQNDLLGGLLLGTAPAQALALAAAADVWNVAGHMEGLGVRLTLDAIDRVARQRIASRLEILLQAGFRILERLRGR